jgi:2'-5' RNA ligase
MQDRLLYVMAQLDKETCEKMRSIDRLLHELGIDVKKPPKVPYHITLGAFELHQELEIQKRVENICRSLPRFPLTYNHIGLFHLSVLFFGPDVNMELLALQQPFEKDRIREHEWTAHTTLMMDEPNVILKALPIVAEQFNGFHATVDSVSLYEFWPSRFICQCPLQSLQT